MLHLINKYYYFVLSIYLKKCVFKTNLADIFCLDGSSLMTK